MPPPTPFDFSWFHRVLILQWVSIGWEELLSYNTPKSSFLLLNSTKDSNHHTNMSQISKNPNYENQQQIPTIKKPFFKKTQTTHFSYHKNQSNSKRKKNNNTNSSIERKKKEEGRGKLHIPGTKVTIPRTKRPKAWERSPPMWPVKMNIDRKRRKDPSERRKRAKKMDFQGILSNDLGV